MAQGRFIPRNPQKYFGNAAQIFFRSSWELTVMKFFDSSISVTRWNSEEVAIPYISPKDGRVHRYYPDFMFEMINTNQEVERWIVEVKPLKEASAEHAKSAYDRVALMVNEAKWIAAERFCQVNGMKFKVITEVDIYRMMPRTAKKKAPKVKKLAANGTKKPVAPRKPKTASKTSITRAPTNDKRKSKKTSA
jgi:hypothetical protein